jgi:hypothetical protein
MMKTDNTWKGELGSFVDNATYRRDTFDAWLAWEFLQRGVSGSKQELTPSEIGELCGKKIINARQIVHRALSHARCNA